MISPGRLTCALAAAAILLAGCARMGRLQNVGPTVSPIRPDSTSERRGENEPPVEPLRALFGDSLMGFEPGTADSAHRFLGRLRDGYTADTLNIMLFGDNRPGYRSSRLQPQLQNIKEMVSLNPLKIGRGLIAIPVALVKGLFPDLALIREVPALVRHAPTWGREHQVLNAMTAKIDSLQAQKKTVAAVINTGDLVYDGRYPATWERFLRITRPLSSRIPYFPVAGNHERTDAVEGVENWRTATGLPIGGDRLYYCFDTADGWVRFIALDTNPIVDPKGHWTREVQVEYSDEEFTWLVARVKEHIGPVIVMMHHPPFSSGTHRMEWQRDPILQERRARMVKALHESGIAIIASGHEHSYQRALLTWPDAVLISIVCAGAGAPLNQIPPPAESARLYSEYAVAGSVVKPQNVLTDEVFSFVHLRLWFGGGEFQAYAVDKNAKTSMIDKVQVDLARYGTPKIDQHKMPLPPAKGPRGAMGSAEDKGMPMPASASKDSISASKRILEGPPPGKTAPTQKKPR
ncbi:MAG TPA: metallophosphoesterase [Candidatus Binatia bacterium]|nr:metallophosphoesterase [Candidatus Binatia bacterium]